MFKSHEIWSRWLIGGLAGAGLALSLSLNSPSATAAPRAEVERLRQAQQQLCNCFVVIVAQSNADFTSVVAALDSINNASADNRYLVWVGPGTYIETGLVQVRGYVHLQGAGPNVTVIQSARSSGSPTAAAATAQLDDRGRISDVTLRNTGSGTYGIGVYSSGATRDSVIVDSAIEAVGAGGLAHYAAFLNDAEPMFSRVDLTASGAVGFGTGVNASLSVINVAGGFPQPLIEHSRLNGGNGTLATCSGNTGTGYAIQAVNASPVVRDSLLCGDRRGIFLGTAGSAQVIGAQVAVSSTGGSFLFETSNVATVQVATSSVGYAGNKHTGTGGLICVHAYRPNFTPVSDGTTPATACN
jgi:hypothetical protein